jgi:hypothetical protein
MLFHVKMTVKLPVDMDPAKAAQLKADEKDWPSACSARAPGATCGASPGTTPTTACSMCPASRRCTTP